MTQKPDGYAKYIASARWKNLRLDLIRIRGAKCERCGTKGHPTSLEVHHKTYERLGRELGSDLEVLCRTCHKTADREREKETEARLRKKVWETPAWAEKFEWWCGKYASTNGWATHLAGDEYHRDLKRRFENWCIERMTGRHRAGDI